MSFVSLVVALGPIWFFLFVKWLLALEGVWQNLVLFGLGVWFLAFFQTVFIVLWVAFFWAVWNAPELTEK